MATVEVQVPEEILALLKRSRVGKRSVEDQLRIALAAHLFQEGVVSAGRASELAGEPQAAFELLLAEMGIPAVRYGLDDLRQDEEALEPNREA